jgi:hypothetical protein
MRQYLPGIDTMKRLKNGITYMAEITQKGARLRIRTENSEALQAIHAFLRFQIADHRTRDSIQVQREPRLLSWKAHAPNLNLLFLPDLHSLNLFKGQLVT